MSDLFPPFEPERVESKRARFKAIPFRLIAPNVVTLIALCLGLTAMRLAVDGKFESATICILVAALLDGIDGRLARLLKGTSRFGAGSIRSRISSASASPPASCSGPSSCTICAPSAGSSC